MSWVGLNHKKHGSGHRLTCFCFKSKKLGLGQMFLGLHLKILTHFAMSIYNKRTYKGATHSTCIVGEERIEGFMRVPHTAHDGRRKDRSMCCGARGGIPFIRWMFPPSHMEVDYTWTEACAIVHEMVYHASDICFLPLTCSFLIGCVF